MMVVKEVQEAMQSGESHYDRRQRRAWRMPVACRAHYTYRDVGRSVLSRDVSTEGVFLDTPIPLAVGTRLDLRITLDTKRPPVAVAGRVVRAAQSGTQPGMALVFTGQALAAARAEIGSFVMESLERQGSSVPTGAWADLEGRIRELDHRARRLNQVVDLLKQERDRLVARGADLERRKGALDHREICINRLEEALDERERTLAEKTQISLPPRPPG
jgi:hypothetical protein